MESLFGEMVGREEFFRKMLDRYFTSIKHRLLSCYFPPFKMRREKEKVTFLFEVQVDQKVSVHLITTQKFASNVQSVLGQSPDIY
jgi:hypothetical protein